MTGRDSGMNAATLGFGLAFGFLFSAAGFNQYDTIHRMLLLENMEPFLVMGSAIATALPILWFLERRGWSTPLGGRLSLRRWEIERSRVYGGVVFGAGWAITGACPGTLSTMIGAGSLMGFVLLAGVIGGIVLHDQFVGRGTQVTGTAQPVTGDEAHQPVT